MNSRFQRPFRLPPAGPIARFGPQAGALAEAGSRVICMLNPLQAREALAQIAGLRRLEERVRRDGAPGIDYQPRARYTLPVVGRWLVCSGGVTRETSHSWDILGQRYALDFVQADERLLRHQGDGTRPDQYQCYGAPIVAAADGTVVDLVNEVGTSPLLGWGTRDVTARSAVGNYLLIQHADSEYALYAHLMLDSIVVEVGQTVRRGDLVGRCGHSGHSSEPHLHFHLQDSPELWEGLGLPIRFHDLRVDDVETSGVHLTAGSWVEPNDN